MLPMIRSLILLASLWGSPASAQGLNWFYCYAPNPSTGRVLISDAQPIGPVSERGAYAREFATYLTARGQLPAGTQAYCVMRSTEQEVRRGQQELAARCDECSGASQFEHVVWPRGGKSVRQVLTGKSRPQPPAAPAQPPVTVEKALAEGAGVYIMARTDQTAIVYVANEENGRFLARFKADQKGGQWTWMLSNDRCSGWLAVAYATNGSARQYFVARGSPDEGQASRKALEAAEAHVQRQGGGWLSGVLVAFQNEYRHRESDFSRGVIAGVRDELAKEVADRCGEFKNGTTWGVRG
jgi:hypothetical protein